MIHHYDVKPCKFVHIPHSSKDKTKLSDSLIKQLLPSFEDDEEYRGSFLIADETILLITKKHVTLIAANVNQQQKVSTIHENISWIQHCDLATDKESYFLSCKMTGKFNQEDYKSNYPTHFY